MKLAIKTEAGNLQSYPRNIALIFMHFLRTFWDKSVHGLRHFHYILAHIVFITKAYYFSLYVWITRRDSFSVDYFLIMVWLGDCYTLSVWPFYSPRNSLALTCPHRAAWCRQKNLNGKSWAQIRSSENCWLALLTLKISHDLCTTSHFDRLSELRQYRCSHNCSCVVKTTTVMGVRNIQCTMSNLFNR